MDNGVTWVDFKNPVGTLSITANGTYNVADYASAQVNVPNPTLKYQTYFSDQNNSGSRTLSCNVGDVIVYAGAISVNNCTALGSLYKDAQFYFARVNRTPVTASCSGFCSAGRIYMG